MKKKSKKIIINIVVLFICLILFGCGKKENNSIVGKWVYNDGNYYYVFNDDNTCTYNVYGNEMKGTYKIDGDKISILYDGNKDPFETTFKIEDNKLNVIDSFGNDTIYERR